MITGVGPHSLGESIAQRLLPRKNWKVIGLDVDPTTSISESDGFFGRQIDLNPFSYPEGPRGFSSHLTRTLTAALEALRQPSICCLIQCASQYWSGPFIETTPQLTANLIGVNLIGRIEVLRSTMMVNSQAEASLADSLVYADVGSFQGLTIRPMRGLYSLTKAASLEFGASLATGNEIGRYIYFAPGPIDTGMLHYNHWVIKSRGSKTFFETLRLEPSAPYDEIFERGNRDAFRDAARKSGLGADAIGTYNHYLGIRSETSAAELGILDRGLCAEKIVDLTFSESRSGVYLLKADSARRPEVVFRAFTEIDRIAAFAP